MRKRYITYGLGEFDINKFEEIVNYPRPHRKPFGGLWASPVNSEYGWKDFCNKSEYRQRDGLDNYFEFTLKPKTKVYKINSQEDYEKIKIVDNEFELFQGIDFEKLKSLGYDAVELTYSGLVDTRAYELDGLYGWDCESIVILNKNCIKYHGYHNITRKV